MAVITSRPARSLESTVGGTSLVARQVRWFIGVAVIAFLVPFLLTTVISMNEDLYYLAYFAVALGVLGTYIAANHVDLARLFAQSWKLSLVLGAISGVG